MDQSSSPSRPESAPRRSFIDRISSGFERLTRGGRRTKELGAAALRLFSRSDRGEAPDRPFWKTSDSKEAVDNKEVKKTKKKNRVASAIAGLFRRSRLPESDQLASPARLSFGQADKLESKPDRSGQAHLTPESSVISRLIANRRESAPEKKPIERKTVDNQLEKSSDQIDIDKETRDLEGEVIQIAPLNPNPRPEKLPPNPARVERPTTTLEPLTTAVEKPLNAPIPEPFTPLPKPKEVFANPPNLPVEKPVAPTIPMDKLTPQPSASTESEQRPATKSIEFGSARSIEATRPEQPHPLAATEAEKPLEFQPKLPVLPEIEPVQEAPKSRSELAAERFSALVEAMEGERQMHNPEYLKQLLGEQEYGEEADENIQRLLDRLRNGELDTAAQKTTEPYSARSSWREYLADRRSKVLLIILAAAILATVSWVISLSLWSG